MKKANEMTAGKGHTGNYVHKLQIISFNKFSQFPDFKDGRG